MADKELAKRKVLEEKWPESWANGTDEKDQSLMEARGPVKGKGSSVQDVPRKHLKGVSLQEEGKGLWFLIHVGKAMEGMVSGWAE